MSKSARLLEYVKEMGIEMVPFLENQYAKEIFRKTMVVLHHSAGWDNARGMFKYWESNKQRVATCVGIQDDGKIFQGFSSKYFAWHINVWSKHNQLPIHLQQYRKTSSLYEKHSIGVEICNWGGLDKRDGKYYAWPNDYGTTGKGVVVAPEKVIDYGEIGFRCKRYYEKYTPSEIESVRRLLMLWGHIYAIPLESEEMTIFEPTKASLEMTPGVYTHCSFRTDKSDIHPQPEMIDMLKNVKHDLSTF